MASVLVVEDEMLLAMVVESMVSALGHTVIGPVADAEAALAQLEAGTPDAVLLDINLSGKPAYPLAAALAARGIPFGFMTGYQGSQLPARWRPAPLLAKPFTQGRLAALLDALLAPTEPVGARWAGGGAMR
jgi:CheY-like chemotaxis protein